MAAPTRAGLGMVTSSRLRVRILVESIPRGKLAAHFSLHGLPLGFYPNPASIVRSVLLDEYQFLRLEPPLLCLAYQICENFFIQPLFPGQNP